MSMCYFDFWKENTIHLNGIYESFQKKTCDGLLMNKELEGEEKFWLIKKSGWLRFACSALDCNPFSPEKKYTHTSHKISLASL